MKKFAALFISVLLVALMVITPVISAAANNDFKTAAEDRDPKYTGTLTLKKYQADPDNDGSDTNKTEKQDPVTGATFTAYRVYDLTNDGTFAVNENNFKGTNMEATLQGYIKNASAEDADGALTYNSTKELQDLIPFLQQVAASLIADDENVIDSEEGADGEYSFGNLPLGIYLVVETGIPDSKDDKPADYAVASVPFLVSIPQWNENEDEDKDEYGEWDFDITAYPKDDEITVKKFITNADENNNDGEDKSANKDIGDKVAYKVVIDIPWYGGPGSMTPEQVQDTVFTFIDTMSEGLTYNQDFKAVVYKADGITVDKEFKLNNGDDVDDDYTFVIDPNASLEVGKKTTITAEFDWASLDEYQGRDLVITYSTTLNDKAVAGVANENAAKLRYSNDVRKNNKSGLPSPGPKDDPDGDPEPPVETKESKTYVYTYEMDLTKTFNGASPYNEETKSYDVDATKVEFTLSYKMDDETESLKEIEFLKVADGKYIVFGDNYITGKEKADEDTSTKLTPPDYERVTVISPDADGKLIVTGLDEGTYILSEVSSVAGWSKLASDVEIKLVGAKYPQGHELAGELNGYLDSATATPGGLLMINKDTAHGEELEVGGHFEITVNNVKKQFELPLTGGAGLLIFTIGGGIVIAGAIIIFSSLRKKKVSE